MNFKQMSKEQRNKIILVLLGSAFLIAALYRFGLVPLMRRHDEAAQQCDDLREKVEKAQMAIHGEMQLDKEASAIHATLEHLFAADIAPPDNALSWATQFIYKQARELGLDVTAIAEIDSAAAGWENPDFVKRSFKPYGVRVELACSFEQIRNLVRSLQQSNPYLAITGVLISSDSKNIEKMAVTLMLEWPSWRDPKQGQHPFETNGNATEKKETKKSA